jgi:hypothetical protein
MSYTRGVNPETVLFGLEDALHDRQASLLEFAPKLFAHLELWAPAGEQMAFEGGFVSKIEVMNAYYRDNFAEPIDPDTNLPLELLTL